MMIPLSHFPSLATHPHQLSELAELGYLVFVKAICILRHNFRTHILLIQNCGISCNIHWFRAMIVPLILGQRKNLQEAYFLCNYYKSYSLFYLICP
jgi:hypothetical protein